MDDSVIRVLREAALADPGDHAVRLHLAQLLVFGGDPAEALEHATAVLAAVPDQIEALTIARDAARALGDEPRAAAYERLMGVTRVEIPAAAEREDGTEAEPDFPHAAPSADPIADDLRPPEVTLADVGGMEEVKRRLDNAFLAPLRNPELRDYYGKSLRGGLLMYGPPGCGKTYIARALAGELGAKFLPVGLNDVLDMWLGESERHLHELFMLARRSSPCVLFLDEIDALGRKRSQLRTSAGRNVINQLLAEMDGVQASNEGVFILAATNHPWDVDTALRRPGRLDRTVLVLPPDQQARAAILAGALKDRPTETLDVASIAKKTDGFSGADLVHLVEVATETALEDSIRTGTTRPIGGSDLDAARRQVSGSTRPWFGVAHGYAVYANDGGEYDDLLGYIRRHKLL